MKTAAFVVASGVALLAAGVAAPAQSLPGLDAFPPVFLGANPSLESLVLGRRLFFDPVLSRDRSVACASCHIPDKAFADGRRLARGIRGRDGTRNVPTIINRAFGQVQFLDGRAASLETQVLEPIGNPVEMDLPVDDAVDRLVNEPTYREAFLSAFGRTANRTDLARALALYVRSILAGDSAVDRYLNGDRAALSVQAREGLTLFRGKAGCSNCHPGPTFTDERFHNTGVAWSGDRWRDSGRFGVTGRETDRGAFKTPTLRKVAATAPYMHDGSLPTLKAVIAFYNRGGRANPLLDPAIRPLDLSSDEQASLVAFLRALTGTITEGRLPQTWQLAQRPYRARARTASQRARTSQSGISTATCSISCSTRIVSTASDERRRTDAASSRSRSRVASVLKITKSSIVRA